MKKSVLMSIQPYWVFLIIARVMGWDIPQDKSIEVRKDFPKDPAWNKVAHIYCSKSQKSFNRIPKEYQPLMAKFLGKVIGEFVCARISRLNSYCLDGEDRLKDMTCLDDAELMDYVEFLDKTFYLWHISDLKIYDKPKELGEFKRECKQYGAENPLCDDCIYFDCCRGIDYDESDCVVDGLIPLTRPPQSWRYIEEITDDE